MFVMPSAPNPLVDVLAPILGQGIQSFGQGIGQGFQQKQRETKNNDVFQQLLNADTPIEQIKLVSSLDLPEKEKLTLVDYLQSTKKSEQVSEQARVLDESLASIGMPANLRKAFAMLGTGGQTELLKHWFESGEREGKGPFSFQNTTEEQMGNVDIFEEDDVLSLRPPTQSEKQDVELHEDIKVDSPYKFPKLPQETGVTSKEREARKNQREKENNGYLSKARDKMKSLEGQELRIDRLESISNSFKLPENPAIRLLASTDVGLKLLSALGNPETQSFIKTIRDFTTLAKDSFGANVTNFEIDQFMQRLPQLLNSSEGRELIIQQMKLVNDADKLDPKSLVDVFQHYGSGGIDYSKATKIADDYSKPAYEKLRKEMKNLSTKSSKLYNTQKKNQSSDKGSDKITIRKGGKTIQIRPEGVEELAALGWEIVE